MIARIAVFALVGGLLGGALIYLSLAFAFWQFDVSVWSVGDRGFAALITLCGIWVGAASGNIDGGL
jgi:hypothetical protein